MVYQMLILVQEKFDSVSKTTAMFCTAFVIQPITETMTWLLLTCYFVNSETMYVVILLS